MWSTYVAGSALISPVLSEYVYIICVYTYLDIKNYYFNKHTYITYKYVCLSICIYIHIYHIDIKKTQNYPTKNLNQTENAVFGFGFCTVRNGSKYDFKRCRNSITGVLIVLVYTYAFLAGTLSPLPRNPFPLNLFPPNLFPRNLPVWHFLHDRRDPYS